NALLSAPKSERPELFKDSPTGRKAHEPLVRTNMPGDWDHDSITGVNSPPQLARYGYRSFDRQFVIADPRFLDRASIAWSMDSSRQVFFTTLTSTRFGQGPAITATPYVPDLHIFSGRGAKNVMPLWLDPSTRNPNVTKGLLRTLGTSIGLSVSAEQFMAY